MGHPADFPQGQTLRTDYGHGVVRCEANGVDYIFGLAGNVALHDLSYQAAGDLKVAPAISKRGQRDAPKAPFSRSRSKMPPTSP